MNDITNTSIEAAPAESAPVAQSFVNADGSFAEGWTDQLGEDFRDSRENLGKFRNLPDVLKSYVALERKIGAKGVIVPTEKSTAEEVASFRRALGVPETAEGYVLKPENLPQGLSWNDELAGQFTAIAHKHNIPAQALKALSEQFTKWQEGNLRAAYDQAQAKIQEGTDLLRKEWGDHFQGNINKAITVANKIGLDPRSPGLSDPAVVKALVRFSSMVSESRFVTSANQGGAFQSARDRVSDIMTNKANPLYQKYQMGDGETVKLVRQLLAEG